MASTSVVSRAVGRAAALGVCLVALIGCGGEPQVEIVVTRGAGLSITPEFLRFAFPLAEGDTVEAGPFPLANVPQNAFAEVPPIVSFSVDVIGCISNERADCEDDGDFVARGCAGPFSRERDTVLAIEVELLNSVDGNARCPVAP